MFGKKKRVYFFRISAMVIAVFLSMSALSACDDPDNTGLQEDSNALLDEILSDPWYYTDDTPVEFDQPVRDEFLKDGGFEYEKSKAQKVFGGEKVKVSKSARNTFVKEYGKGVFDKSAGTGVFLVSDPAFSGMNHHGFYLEYTSDKGSNWKICDGAYYEAAYPADIKLSGKKVYIIMCSEPSMKSYILYSDDLCKTFRIRDVITLLPDYAELMYCHTANVDVVELNSQDSTITFGWYDYDYIQEKGGDSVSYFLTAKFDSDLTEGKVVSADDEYIKKTAEKIGENDEIDG